MLDVIIIGGVPAGLNASLYARRAGLSVVILEKLVLGGQVGKTHEVENYIGIDNILGPDLVLKMEQHARRFGADIKYEEVIDINFSGIEKEVITKKNVYRSKTVIIATGSTPRYLNVP